MLPEKPWKPDLLMRLFIGVMICVFLGPLLVSVAHFQPGRGRFTPLAFYALAGGALAGSAGAMALNLLPWKLEHLPRRFLAIGVCFLVSLNLTALLQRSAGSSETQSPALPDIVIATLSFQGAALLLAAWFVRRHGMNFAEAFGIRRGGWGRALLMGGLAAVAVTPLAWGLQVGCAKLLTVLHYEVKPQQMVEFLRLTESWPARLYIGFSAIVLAPLAEETLFRGILYTAIRQFGFPRAALWGTALLFAAFHSNLPSFLPLTVLAVVLAKLYDKTNNLLAPIAAHCCFNAANAILLYLLKIAGYLD